LTDSDDLGRKLIRQVAGAFIAYEKGRLVAKLSRWAALGNCS